MKLSKAAEVLGASLQGQNLTFQSVSIDTRTLSPKDLFIAIRGPNFDGHDFVDRAAGKGAVAAVVSQATASSIPLLIVSDTRKALINLAAYHREQLQPTIIAVTGSCGKTTTKTFLASIFSQQDRVLANSSSFNNDVGVPLTLLQLKPEHRYAVCEMGADHPGEIAVLTHLVKPDVAIITNAAAAHLEGFGDLDGVACAKSEIFQGLHADGIAIINADDAHADFWKKQAENHRVVTFGIYNPADVMAKDIQVNRQVQPNFRLILPDEKITVTLQLMGEHNVMNALAASAAAYAQGIAIDKITKGLESTTAVNRRLVEKKGYAGSIIIDDTYNANPSSTSAAMSILSQRSGESVFVLGDMLALGDNANALHQEIGEKAQAFGIHRLYCLGEHSRYAAQAFGENAYHFEDRDELLAALRNYLHDNMTVLIKGSNLMGMDKIAQALTED